MQKPINDEKYPATNCAGPVPEHTECECPNAVQGRIQGTRRVQKGQHQQNRLRPLVRDSCQPSSACGGQGHHLLQPESTAGCHPRLPGRFRRQLLCPYREEERQDQTHTLQGLLPRRAYHPAHGGDAGGHQQGRTGVHCQRQGPQPQRRLYVHPLRARHGTLGLPLLRPA